jgi:hypothetical protein
MGLLYDGSWWGRGANEMRKKKRRLDKGTEARRLARNVAAKPSSTRVVEDKRKKPEKHKRKSTETPE